MISAFLSGFAAYSYFPFSADTPARNFPRHSSFADDQKHLQADFLNAYFSILHADMPTSDEQLSLKL